MGGHAARDISLDVVTVPTWRELRRRLPQLLVGIPVVLLVANLVAFVPGRVAARLRPAAVLRSE